MNDTQLKEYLGAMITEYDKLMIGEYNREEGRKEERKAIIKALLDSGMSLKEISQRLQIPVEELELCEPPTKYIVTFPLSGRFGDLHPLEYVRAGRT